MRNQGHKFNASKSITYQNCCFFQVFYMCQPNGNYDSFLCPNGTIFNQQYFICDWWYNVDCAASSNFYALNEFIYQDQEDGKNCQSLFCIDDQKFRNSQKNPPSIHIPIALPFSCLAPTLVGHPVQSFCYIDDQKFRVRIPSIPKKTIPSIYLPIPFALPFSVF